MEKEILPLLEEIKESIRALSDKQNSQYTDIMMKFNKIDEQANDNDYDDNGKTFEELYVDARKVVIEARKASTSYLQRKLGIGYAISARLIDKLEEDGVVTSDSGARPRNVLINE